MRVDFVNGRNASYPEEALQRDLGLLQSGWRRCAPTRRRPKRLADNMLDLNPVSTDSLVQLMWGALVPSREGGLLYARLRYFDPVKRRAGVPDDVAALVSELSETRTTVTLVNLSPSQPRTVIVEGGGYGEHRLTSVTAAGVTTPINAPLLTVELDPGAGQTLVLEMKRYANPPTALHPWQRTAP